MSSLTQQAEVLLAYAKRVDAFLEAKQLSPPSFDHDTLSMLSADQQVIRDQLVNAADDFRKLVRGPVMTTTDIAFNWTDVLPLQVIYHYQLAKLVPLDGQASYADIAQQSGLREELVRQYLRAAMGNRIFAESEAGQVRHTAISRLLATDQSLQDAVRLQTEECGPPGRYVTNAWKVFGQDAYEPTQTAWQLANGTDKSLFNTLAENPERARRFGSAMHFHTSDDSWHLRHLVASYDWSSIDQPGACLVDVGGGFGHVSQYLAKHTQHLRFIVEDLPHVVSTAGAKVPLELQGRITFTVHDFLVAQPAEQAVTAFFLRFVLHNWSDHYACIILRNLIPALRSGSKVLLHEYVLPEQPDTTLTGRFGFQLDMIMATNYNGKARTATQWVQLLAQADPRFVVDAVHKPEGSVMSLVEVSWKG